GGRAANDGDRVDEPHGPAAIPSEDQSVEVVWRADEVADAAVESDVHAELVEAAIAVEVADLVAETAEARPGEPVPRLTVAIEVAAVGAGRAVRENEAGAVDQSPLVATIAADGAVAAVPAVPV